jgi:hypothetical protein
LLIDSLGFGKPTGLMEAHTLLQQCRDIDARSGSSNSMIVSQVFANLPGRGLGITL